MSKLIDADLFLEQENERYRAVKEKTSDKKTLEISRKVHFAIRAMISVAPDGVVRCRYCKNYRPQEPEIGLCDRLVGSWTNANCFCSHGEPAEWEE